MNCAKSVSISFMIISLFLGSSCVTIQMPAANGTPHTTPTSASTPSPLPSTPGSVNGKTITADMSDAQILTAFGVDINKATSNVTRGQDGYTTTYVFERQTVSITRSVVTGVAVMAFGEPIKGDWALGGKG